MTELLEKAQKAKACSQTLATKTTQQKNDVLLTIADQLLKQTDDIIKENQKDIQQGREKGLHDSLIDRLLLSEDRINTMAQTLKEQVNLPDPIGQTLEAWEQSNGMKIKKVSVPLGVVGMVYEARPNVTVDAASLCLKTGNAVYLRGSSSAIYSNKILVHVIQQALQKADFPPEAVQLLEDRSHETAAEMFKLNDYIDVLIPRGSAALIQTVVQQSSIPVLETGAGNCHIFIDASADPHMAQEITINAKTQRPSVCNTAETIVVQADWAREHLRDLTHELVNHQVELHGDDQAQQWGDYVLEAGEEDWETEYLDNILAVKVVADVKEAIEHINHYGTTHSEAIITENPDHVQMFFNTVDAAALYHNASTRFTDGQAFGFGAEIGISTQKLHARGPMGLPALTSTKYIVEGSGQIKA